MLHVRFFNSTAKRGWNKKSTCLHPELCSPSSLYIREGPKLATRGGWMGADQNFSWNRSVGQYPENHHKPSNLGWENSYGLAISKQKPLGRETEAMRKNSPNSSTNRSDRSGWNLNFQTGYTDRSDRSLPDSPQPKLQMANLEQTKSKSNETWRIPSHLSREHIPKRSLPKD